MTWRWGWNAALYRYPFYRRGEQREWRWHFWGITHGSYFVGVSRLVEPQGTEDGHG